MRKRVVFHVLTVTGLLAATVFSLAHAQEPRILFIGDSHTAGTFGDEFAKELASAFHGQVSRYGVSSSAVLHWMGRSSFARLTGGWRTSQVGTDGNHTNVNGDPRGHVGPDFPTYTQLLGQGFDVVVIALGTNDVMNYCSWNQARQAEAIQLAKSMADRTSGNPSLRSGLPPLGWIFSQASLPENPSRDSAQLPIRCGYFRIPYLSHSKSIEGR